MKSTIKLFKAIPITKHIEGTLNKKILKKTIKKGFIFTPDIYANHTELQLNRLIKLVDTELNLNPEEMNSSFHKSWKKVKDADMETLVLEQIVHYITTYGFEALGIYDGKFVYIPKERLDIPNLDDTLNLMVIKGYTKDELKDKLLNLLQSGIALKEDTMTDIMDVFAFVGLSDKDIETIKNKEVKILMYDSLDMVPENPIEFLRSVIYKATGKTLLIKDKDTIESIKNIDNDKFNAVYESFELYNKTYGLTRLSEIFYRFKPLFLAYREDSIMRPTINKIRKLAVKYHKPMVADYLNGITADIKNGLWIHPDKLNEELAKVNTFRKIRLLYALKYRTTDPESIMYKIRNGKGYATAFAFKNKGEAKNVLTEVLKSIIKDIEPNVKGKKIYIPEHIRYTLPATEKQFTGYFPSGSYIDIPKDMVVGIHWNNVDHNRIDLDLSMVNQDTKIGWDANYRTSEGNILFSGDMTDASGKDGASELFYVQRQVMTNYLLLVNYFNYNKDINVLFKIMVGKEQVRNLKNNYMIDPNNVLSIANVNMTRKQKILGLLSTTTKGCKFYFAETDIGQDITSSLSEVIIHSKNYMGNFYKNTISLNDILKDAGAMLTEYKDTCDIDLSPENLEKDTILNLINRK
jgi:hypothetical protein